jgi:small-conductance mechanosensitive channel
MLTELWDWEKIFYFSAAIAGALLFALVFHYVLFKILKIVSKRTGTIIDDSFIRNFRKPVLVFFVLIAIWVIVPYLDIPDNLLNIFKNAFSIALVIFFSWFIIRSTNLLEDFIFARFDVDKRDNLQARKIHTQLKVLKRIVVLIVCIVAFATILMTFEKARRLGTTILASAGILGIVVGMAAQKTIGTFIAGLQIAFTQPIRVDDVVIVENEWGRIEEINLTYVVVKIWDLRRLVVPITYFIEKPFQNWTRKTADILGTVYIYVDYTVPVQNVREELKRILESSEHWDHKVCVLQVTNSSERTMELRALMSAADASTAWTLRCEVREKLVNFIQKHYPQALPKVRAELEKE